MESFACPCCGYKTLSEQGSYLICPVCYWEDDLFQSNHPDLSGANKTSLRNAQHNFIKIQVCDLDMKSFIRAPKAEESRMLIGAFYRSNLLTTQLRQRRHTLGPIITCHRPVNKLDHLVIIPFQHFGIRRTVSQHKAAYFVIG